MRSPLSGITTKLQVTYAQITLNRVTVAFFLFSFIHCIAQGLVHSFNFQIDSQFAGMVTGIVRTAEIPFKNITYLEGSSGRYTLRMCNDIPYAQSPDPCMVIFQSSADAQNGSDVGGSSLSIVQDLTEGFSLAPARNSSNEVIGVTLQSSTDQVFLSQQCAQILVYPQTKLDQAVREDVAFIFLHFWLLGVSIYAVSRCSVPHILTAFGTRILIAAWSAYIAAYRTNNEEVVFHQLVSAPGTPCGVELFPTYFGVRQAFDIADLILSCTALILSGLLSRNLLKVYNARSFKRVGAPAHITRIYKFFMAIEACLQLEVFVLMAATGLWIDVLINTGIRLISTHTALYDALIISTSLLVLPWIALGWYGVKRESRRMMIAFFAIAFYFIAGWSVMFYSQVYRWTFIQWPNLGCFTVASFILIIASVILAAVCSRNFDKGLAQYLHAEAALASLNFAPEVFENSDVEKSGKSYYEEPEYPMPIFEPPSSKLAGGQLNDSPRMPGPVRGPPPIYDKPYTAPV
ncbi:hypothetical protein B0H11DRAFT_495803 [Mycena galericulata]|nr:hypothetical protein B0H11DRAFT_495803 [Mycena galericulata]